jgi:hypothetical protein
MYVTTLYAGLIYLSIIATQYEATQISNAQCRHRRRISR